MLIHRHPVFGPASLSFHRFLLAAAIRIPRRSGLGLTSSRASSSNAAIQNQDFHSVNNGIPSSLDPLSLPDQATDEFHHIGLGLASSRASSSYAAIQNQDFHSVGNGIPSSLDQLLLPDRATDKPPRIGLELASSRVSSSYAAIQDFHSVGIEISSSLDRLSLPNGAIKVIDTHRRSNLGVASLPVLSAIVKNRNAPRRGLYQFNSPRFSSTKAIEDQGKISFVVRLYDIPGALENVLRILREESVNLTRIESRPSGNGNCFDVFLDADAKSKALPLERLNKAKGCKSVDLLGTRCVPWFPRRRIDLDAFSKKTLDAGMDITADHPGFKDTGYRQRRNDIVGNAKSFQQGGKIPAVEYSLDEIKTWSVVYDELKKRYPMYACEEFQSVFKDLEGKGLYTRDEIPQLQDINSCLNEKTGFCLRPVGGLLSARDFLNGLAVKCFHSTQYIRHHSFPFYTPEPDVCHELLGHVPMLFDPDFAALSHSIGLASCGASDSDIKRLATCYWFSVEFGLVLQNNQKKAYGAGLLSSFGELEFACAANVDAYPEFNAKPRPEFVDWDPDVAADTDYSITTYQNKYFVADGLHSAAQSMREFCENSIKRPFYSRYDDASGKVFTVDRVVRRRGSVVGL